MNQPALFFRFVARPVMKVFIVFTGNTALKKNSVGAFFEVSPRAAHESQQL